MMITNALEYTVVPNSLCEILIPFFRSERGGKPRRPPLHSVLQQLLSHGRWRVVRQNPKAVAGLR